jgi:hypothetical protein
MQSQEPTEISAGDSLTWARTVDGYASGQNWSLAYYLQCGGKPLITVPAVPDSTGRGFVVTVDAATTAAWAPGQYSWKAVVSGIGPNVGKRETVAWSQLVVLPDPTQVSDPRSHFRRCYEAITAVIEGRMSDPITRYKIGDTEAQKLPHMDLIRLQAYYASRLRSEAGRPLVTAHRVVLH